MTDSAPKKSEWFGPALVMLASAVLTITILGSSVYLGVRFYEKKRRENEIERFVASLPNRSATELAEQAKQLKQRKGVRSYLLPAIRRTMLAGQTEQQRWSAVRISGAFLDSKGVRKTLLRLAKSGQERLAAEATHVLSKFEPPDGASVLLLECLDNAVCPAVVDEVCAAFFRLGSIGLDSIKKRSDEISEGRKIWLVRYVTERGDPAQSRPWLEWLASVPEKSVARSANAALVKLSQSATIAGTS